MKESTWPVSVSVYRRRQSAASHLTRLPHISLPHPGLPTFLLSTLTSHDIILPNPVNNSNGVNGVDHLLLATSHAYFISLPILCRPCTRPSFRIWFYQTLDVRGKASACWVQDTWMLDVTGRCVFRSGNVGNIRLVYKGFTLIFLWRYTVRSDKRARSKTSIVNDWFNKHNAELQRADPGTKDTGYFSTRGSIFPHDAQNRFLSFPSF